MTQNLMRSLALSVIHEKLKAHREEYADEHSGTHTLGYLLGVDYCLRLIEDEAERIPAPKPYKAPQMTPCIDVNGKETMEEIR